MPNLESAGALWWRAQLRRRNAAIEKVGQPILGAQIFALMISVVVAGAMIVWKGNTLKAWLEGLPRALHFDALVPVALSQSTGLAGILIPVFATVALVSGVVVYIATERQ
jgi:hypothetical protein